MPTRTCFFTRLLAILALFLIAAGPARPAEGEAKTPEKRIQELEQRLSASERKVGESEKKLAAMEKTAAGATLSAEAKTLLNRAAVNSSYMTLALAAAAAFFILAAVIVAGPIKSHNAQLSETIQAAQRDISAIKQSLPAPSVSAAPVPEIAGVEPDEGPVDGDTLVTIKGANFEKNAEALFSGVAGEHFKWVSATEVTVRTPQRGEGDTSVKVLNGSGQAAERGRAFTYLPKLEISEIRPNPSTEKLQVAKGEVVVTVTGLRRLTSILVDGKELSTSRFLLPASKTTELRAKLENVKKDDQVRIAVRDAGRVDLVEYPTPLECD